MATFKWDGSKYTEQSAPEQPVAETKTPIASTTPEPVKVTTPAETVNIGGQEPVKNKITGGFETINPTVAVDTQMYTPEQKAKAVTDLGYSLKPGMEKVDYTKIRDAFYRKEDGIGVKEEMLSPYFEKKAAEPTAPTTTTTPTVTAPTTPTTPTTGVTAPTPTTPTQTTDEINKQQLDSIFKSNSLSEDEKSWWMNNIFNTPESRADFFKKTDAERKEIFDNVLFANRATRDASLQAEYSKKQYDYKVEQQKAEFELQKTKMEAQMDADANNMSISQGVSGRIQSQNMANAVKQQLALNQKVYNEMISAQDRYMNILAEEYKYNNQRASNDYNDAMSQVKKDLLEKINGLTATGVMNTKSGLLQAQSFVDAAAANGLNAMKQYQYNLAIGAERAKALADQLKEQNTYSDQMTNQMNDGYLYTAQGTKMTDSSGAFLKRPANVAGVPMFKEPQKADDGTYFQAYQQPDGTIKTVKLSGIEGTAPADEAVNAYARLLADKTIGIGDLKWMSPAARDRIIQAAGAYISNKPEEIKPSDYLKMEDADGNAYYYNPKTKESITPQKFAAALVNAPTSSLDFTGLAAEHPGEASFKNNNPAGITWHAASQGLKDAWTAAGVKFEMGTARPSNEGGNYVKFATVIDGINAREIAMERKGGSVFSSLKQWVGTTNDANNTAYANSILQKAGIDGNKTYAQLSDAEKESLSIAQLQREANGMYKEMIKRGYITEEGIDYGKIESDAMAEQAQAPVENQYTGIAKDLASGVIKSSDLKNLGYKPSEIQQIESERRRLSAQSTIEGLSTAAQRAVSAKAITETGKDKTKVLNELQEAGVFDLGEGNQNYYEAKADVKAEMPNFFNARDAFNKAKSIVEKHKAAGDLNEFLGSYDAAQQRLKAKTGAFTDKEFQNDFNALDNLLGRELSNYMKNISGAAVSENEAERLKRQIPNVEMGESEFEQAMQIYEDSLKNASRYMVNHYGFTDDATARNIILWESGASTATSGTGIGTSNVKKNWKDYEITQ